MLQFNADNPGVWPFHCHIAWHVSSGLYVNIMERPADIKQTQIPSVSFLSLPSVVVIFDRDWAGVLTDVIQVMAQTCRDWATWSGHNVVDQIDSGL